MGGIRRIMCKITSGSLNSGVTVISNRFIDEYLVDASGLNLKVYLYLLRYSYVPGADISLKSIAETLDYTSNQIIKSLKYWQKLSVLDFSLDENGEIKRINMYDVNTIGNISEKGLSVKDSAIQETAVVQETASIQETAVIQETASIQETAVTQETVSIQETAVTQEPAPIHKNAAIQEKIFPHYSAEQINLISEDKHFKYLIKEVEKLFAPDTLAYKDINTLAGIYEGFGFSDELIMHLYNYCISKGSKDHRYIEKVATGWAEKNIRTITQAQFEAQFHDKLINDIRKNLGMLKALGIAQIKTVEKWVYEYKLSNEVILTACDRAALAEVEKPFAYASKIIDYWHNAGINSLEDIKRNDELHSAESIETSSVRKTQASRKAQAPAYNQFNDFNQRNYSKESESELEKKLIMNNSHSKAERDALADRLKKA